MGQVAVYSDVERRRRRSDDERLQILGEAFSPGAVVTQVARQYDVSTALIYTWRRKLLEASADPAPAIIVDLARGRRVSVFASASPALVAAALKALR